MTVPGRDSKDAAIWRLKLTVTTGPDAGKSCSVDRDVVSVGKMPDCDLVMTDPTVSRRHLRIGRTSDDRWSVVDLGSTNGTFVQGTRVREAIIEEGTLLAAGQARIIFAPTREEIVVPPWPEEHFQELVGRSKAMRTLFGMIARIAETEATVLIEGETGTGKGAVARVIHQTSHRAAGPYMVVDCGAVQRQLIESELFGHTQGAFTGAYDRRRGVFELASGGTVFLDELGELELDLQPKLLRVLDAREVRPLGAASPIPVDLRVIAASRRPLSREVERGVFREDLFFRLSVVTLRIPPLRERLEDVPLLAERFLQEICESRGVEAPPLDGDTVDWLTSHDWPGNVRELKNAIERAVLLSAVQAGHRLDVGQLGASNASKAAPSASRRLTSFDPTLSFSVSKERWLAERERAYVQWLLQNNETISEAARAARMDRKYLHKLIKKHGLEGA